MKIIILDFLRRWFGVYVIGVLFAVVTLVGSKLAAGFTLAVFLMLPLSFELRGRPAKVIMTFPVSRGIISLSYWLLAVLLPVLLLAVALTLVRLMFPSLTLSPKNAAAILLDSLALGGTTFCFFTFISQENRVRVPNIIPMFCASTWICCWGLSRQGFSYLTMANPVVYLTVLTGFLFTFWGYVRAEKLLIASAATPLQVKRPSLHLSTRAPSLKPRMMGFPAIFFELARTIFLVGLVYAAVILLLNFRHVLREAVWCGLFSICVAGSSRVLTGGTRFLRSLPLSTDRLAFCLLLLTMVSLTSAILAVGVLHFVSSNQVFVPQAASFLIPMAGSICVVSSLCLPLSGDFSRFVLPFGILAPLAVFELVSNTHWPAAFWWILGFCLIAAAFFLNRHWLRSSLSYRRPVGDS